MNANWFAAHVDLMLFVYSGLAFVAVAATLWRARRRKHSNAADAPGLRRRD